MKPSGNSLRRELQSLRSGISSADQLAAAASIVDPVVTAMPRTAGIVAGYVAHGGEIDPLPTLRALTTLGWDVVLPICGDDASMDFSPWEIGQRLEPNRYGIGEPIENPVPIQSIDVVLVPGVGFDHGGARIGHGVGFYDRFFARCFAADHDPLRLALAHDVQIVALPEPEAWDVPMHTLITPSQVIDTGRCA